MDFIRQHYVLRKLRGLSLRIFNWIENNGIADFDINGEKVFVEQLFASFLRDASDGRSKKRIVFDIGANRGEYAEMILQRAERSGIVVELHLFEPTGKCFETLRERFKGKPAVLNHFGVSDKEATATIYYDKAQSGLASLYRRNLDAYDLSLDLTESIKLMPMEGYIRDNNIEHIDFIKIDVEGHELKSFEGFGLYLDAGFIDFIQFEYGGANLDSHTSLMELYALLTARGFRIAKIMKNGLEIRRYEPFMENFTYANYVAVSEKVLNDSVRL